MTTFSDNSDVIGRLRNALWHHDWDDVASLALELGRQEPPADPGELQHHLTELAEALSLARASRLELFSTLGRLRAIAGFNDTSGHLLEERQVFAAATDSCRAAGCLLKEE